MAKIKLVSVLALLLAGTVLPATVAEAQSGPKDDAVRAEVGEPLQEARNLLQSGQYQQALARIEAAEAAVETLEPYEAYVIDRMRGSVAVGNGDYNAALAAYQRVLESEQLPPNERMPIINAMARMAYASGDYPRSIELIRQYRDEGGTGAETLNLLPQAYYQIGQFDAAARELVRQIESVEKAGARPSEQKLQLLASTQLKQDNPSGYLAALRKTVAHYPKNDYWSDLIIRTARHADLPPRLSLDLYRLRKYTGTIATTGDYMDATQLALKKGLPKEAESFLNEGFRKNLLGRDSGGNVDRHERLREMVARKIAEDEALHEVGEREAAEQPGGDALVVTGLNYVTYGQYEKGLALMEEGLAKGALEYPRQARLHLGYAQLLAGREQAALETFGDIEGEGGEAELARLWLLAGQTR